MVVWNWLSEQKFPSELKRRRENKRNKSIRQGDFEGFRMLVFAGRNARRLEQTTLCRKSLILPLDDKYNTLQHYLATWHGRKNYTVFPSFLALAVIEIKTRRTPDSEYLSWLYYNITRQLCYLKTLIAFMYVSRWYFIHGKGKKALIIHKRN